MPFDEAFEPERQLPSNPAGISFHAPDRKTPWWVRLLGGSWYEGGTFRAPWGEFVNRLGLALSVCKFEDHWSLNIHLGWPGAYINLPFRVRSEPEDMMESWGFSLFEKDVHLRWGRRSKIIHWPFRYVGVHHDILCSDGEWRRQDWRDCKPTVPDEIKLRLEYPYKYLTNGGELQEVTATVTPERWVRYPRKWLRWPRRIEYAIDIQFSDEVGSERGSWKGGCVGCGWGMNPGETPLHALRRMERTRRFCR